jgi:hypothetical protein
MINFWGYPERSTYHNTCVKKVFRYLKKKCDNADYERKLVADRITDALGCNTKSKTWYLCEIKVNWNDAQKGVTQIHDTAFRFRKTHRGYNIVPVLAIPSRLQKELVKFDNWNSLRDQCKNSNIAIWVIEATNIREISSSKTGVEKNKRAVIKVTKYRKSKTKTTKRKTTMHRINKPNKRVVKSPKTKKPKTQSTKRKTTKTRTVKSRATKYKKKT